MSENIKHISDASFETDVLKSERTGTGRLLGRVVRSLQDDRPDPRRSREGIQRQAQIAKMDVDANQAVPASSASAVSRP
jgi:thioredoxin 1